MTYEGWVYEDWWRYYPNETLLSTDYNVGILKTSDNLLVIKVYEHEESYIPILDSRLDNFFTDINNPTEKELMMFQLQYGIDLSEPLGVKK